MAKKKKINNNKSFNKILGFDFIQNEKVIFVCSIILLAVAIFFVASFVPFHQRTIAGSPVVVLLYKCLADSGSVPLSGFIER